MWFYIKCELNSMAKCARIGSYMFVYQGFAGVCTSIDL